MSEYIDISYLNEVTGNDLDFAKELYQIYKEDTDRRITDLESAITNLNFNTIRIQAHTIKGASANVGANKLMIVAKDLEDCGLNKEDSNILEKFNILKSTYEKTINAYKEHFVL